MNKIHIAKNITIIFTLDPSSQVNEPCPRSSKPFHRYRKVPSLRSNTSSPSTKPPASPPQLRAPTHPGIAPTIIGPIPPTPSTLISQCRQLEPPAKRDTRWTPPIRPPIKLLHARKRQENLSIVISPWTRQPSAKKCSRNCMTTPF